MLSLFPELLDWSWYVPFIFRIFLGIYILCTGLSFTKKYIREKNVNEAYALLGTGVLLVLLGLAFLVGVVVQALGAIGFTLAMLAPYFQKKSPYHAESAVFYFLIGLVSLSLVFLGPGPYSFDLPL